MGRAVIGALQVPVAIDDKGRIGLLLRQDMAKRMVDMRQLRPAELALLPDSGITG